MAATLFTPSETLSKHRMNGSLNKQMEFIAVFFLSCKIFLQLMVTLNRVLEFGDDESFSSGGKCSLYWRAGLSSER